MGFLDDLFLRDKRTFSNFEWNLMFHLYLYEKILARIPEGEGRQAFMKRQGEWKPKNVLDQRFIEPDEFIVSYVGDWQTFHNKSWKEFYGGKSINYTVVGAKAIRIKK